jgi:RND family efflux transporter MFP subunit
MNPACKLFTACLLAAVASGCGKQEPAAPDASATPLARPIAASAVVKAERRTLRPGFELPAVIEAVQSASIRPEVSATLKATHFSPGDVVEEGKLLVELDDSKYRAAVNAAKAQLQSARASATQAGANWERAKKLRPQGYISEMDYDKAKAAIDTSSAAIAGAEATLEQAELDLKHTKVYAPFSGRISKSNYAVGDLINPAIPGSPPIFELVQLDPIYATASVEQSTYNNFTLFRQKLTDEGLEIPEVVVQLELAGDNIYPEQGKFENWSHSSQGSSGTVTGRVLFPNPNGLLLPGTNVTVIGEAQKTIERIMVPQRAVNQDQQGHYVMVIDKDNTVQRKNIKVGARDGKDWAARSGVEEGDMVIADGAGTFKAGTKVEIK